MRFEQIAKHRAGGHGSPCVFPTEEEAARALQISVEIKPGMRAVRLASGQVAVFRNASKKPGTMGHDVWHGGWAANQREIQEIAGLALPTLPT